MLVDSGVNWARVLQDDGAGTLRNRFVVPSDWLESVLDTDGTGASGAVGSGGLGCGGLARSRLGHRGGGGGGGGVAGSRGDLGLKPGPELRSDLRKNLVCTVILHQALDCVVLEQQPCFLWLRLPQSMDATHGLEDAIVILRGFHRPHAATFGVHVESNRATGVGRQEDVDHTIRVGKALNSGSAGVE
ncbi:hypothetical protein PEXP_049610 [Penicillium expansum]|nr:hypothetical protein PEXP_049610 [Penicillium expansum]